MKESIELWLKEHDNGYSVKLYHSEQNNYPIDEIREERLEALKSIKLFIDNQIRQELIRRQQYAGEGAV